MNHAATVSGQRCNLIRSRSLRLRAQRGIAMIEVGLALLIIIAASIYAVIQYNASRSDSKVQNEVTDTTRYLSKTQDAYSSLPDYAGVTTAVLIGNNVFNPRMVNAARTAVVNNFNGAVTAAPATLVNANDSAAVTSVGYDRSACAALPNKLSNAVRRMDINGTTVKPDGGNLDPTLVSTSCLANGNTIIFYAGK